MEIFSQYYQDNFWQNDESVSGHGSTLAQTAVIREELPRLLRALDVQSMLDIPCGDLNWMKEIQSPDMIPRYIGADVVPELVSELRKQFGHQRMEFQVMDITKDRLSRVDLVLVRDLLGHFSNRDVQSSIKNLKRSGSTWLLATTFPEHTNEGDIRTGEWRPINLARWFGLPNPELLINEYCTEGGGAFADKSLGLWKLQEEF